MTVMNLSLRVQLAVNYARQQCSVENIQPWIYSVQNFDRGETKLEILIPCQTIFFHDESQ